MKSADSSQITQPVQPSDQTIHSNLMEYLRNSPGVDEGEVEATVTDGTVTLTGAVDAVPERRRVREIAETTPGVRAVVDKLTIRNFVDLEDDELKSALVNALSRDAFVESLPSLEIYVHNGEVRLEGKCKTWHERSAIADTVWWTPGVRNVEC